MKVPGIGAGPSNLVAEQVVQSFYASEAIAKGEPVALVTNGYTAAKCNTTDVCIGIAKEAIASGSWGEVIRSGWCDYIVTDENVAAGVLYVQADGVVSSIAEADIDTEAEIVLLVRKVGVAVTSDTGAVGEGLIQCL